MKQTVFTNKNFFKINIDDYATQKEVKVIVESFKECVDIFYTTFNALRKDTKKKASEFETIFGNAESKTMLVVLNSLYEIKSLLGSEIKFMRQSFFFDRKHQKHADVLASANLHQKSVSIYNTFFEKEFRKEDNRGGVIFHELAHLVGLKDESELNNLKSAECLKNFALLVSGRMSVEDVVDNNNENIEKSDPIDEELTYSPDQPRAPKGQPNGGQWIDKNGGNSSESSQSKKENTEPKNTENNSTQNQNVPEENSNTSNKISNGFTGNHLDTLPKEEREKYIKNGIIYEDKSFITVSDDKYTDIKILEPQMKHGGFGNDKIDSGPEEDSKRPDYGKEFVWGGLDGKLSGLSSNIKYTIIQTNTFYCESEFKDHKENFEKCVTVAFEIESNENGEAILKRVGVVREPHECENGMPLKKIKIDMSLKIIEGGINKHFNKINRITNDLESIDYVITHANGGGEVDKTEADKLDTKLIFMGKFEKYANKIQSKR